MKISLCVDCATIYKQARCTLLYPPPYLNTVVRCFRCGREEPLACWVDLDMPRKRIRVLKSPDS